MTKIADDALAFFDACETGKGWAACAPYCAADATFDAQADALTGVTTLQGYVEWMAGLFTPIPDGSYEIKGFAVDEARGVALAFAVFSGTQTGEGGPVPPTGRTAAADYVYAMRFEGGKIIHMTKIWNDAHTMRSLGWA